MTPSQIRNRLAAGVPVETIAWEINMCVSEVYRLAGSLVEADELAPVDASAALAIVPEAVPSEPKSGVRTIGEVVRLPVVDFPDVDRPKTRADCKDGPRPCPFVSCEHHVYVDVYGDKIKLAREDLDPDELPETCVLDVADGGGATLEAIAGIYGQTRERIRQIETLAFRKIRARNPGLADELLVLAAMRDERLT